MKAVELGGLNRMVGVKFPFHSLNRGVGAMA